MANNATTRPKGKAKNRRHDGQANTKSGGHETGESIKETLESVVIAFILAFVFRAFVVEAFVIPTGSMAPTLLGRNIPIYCSQCGYHYKADPDDSATRDAFFRTLLKLTRTATAPCPMCHYRNILEKQTRINSGDRILVHKYIYSLSNPKRWDVVVFKNPKKPIKENFIKRLIGLPNESIWIIEGNVYSKNILANDQAWRIARKTDKPKVQRDIWQPIHRSIYLPLDNGRNRTANSQWSVPWVAIGEYKDQWQIEQQRSYGFNTTHHGTIMFDFNRARCPSPSHWYPYNQLRPHEFALEPIEDIRVSVGFQAHKVGLEVALQTTARMHHNTMNPQLVTITIRIDRTGLARLIRRDPKTGHTEELAASKVGPFVPGKTRTVELWHVDQQISVWLDGQRIDDLLYEYEVDIDVLKNRRPLKPNFCPDVKVSVNGSPVHLHGIELDRDLYYSSNKPRSPHPGRGTRNKTRAPYKGDPAHLKADQFYCLGDNSPMSQDSRYWERPDPWIKYHMFPDQSNDQSTKGIVPRRLIMGKAFFVYFPAALAWNDRSFSIIPNFGEMRFIH